MRRRERGALAALAALGCFALGAALTSGGSTYAAFSDHDTLHGAAAAGTWEDPLRPDPPAACGPVSDYSGIVYGTPGIDVIVGLGRRQIIMGLGGDDTLIGGLSGDCLVGGPGDDILYGGLGRDIVIGGPGTDLCLSITSRDVLIDCELGDLGLFPALASR
jgi:Ca2+-binding RTX toxin-like protein